MPNINKIKLSGTTYSIQDENACKVVELTQAEYDELSPKDPNVFYIITDATAGDLSNYYTKPETSGATEISTALASKADTATTYTKTETDNAITAATSTKQDTLVSGTNIKTINGETLLGEGNITIQGGSGGGKAIEAGRGISITTGETADTINCTLPISGGTGRESIITSVGNKATHTCAMAIGYGTKAIYQNAFAQGAYSEAKNYACHAEGEYSIAEGYVSHAEGYRTNAKGEYTHTEGNYTKALNSYEHASCQYNNSVSASKTFGDSGNTLFSVGNGTSESARHNAFEIRQNGDIYIADTNDTSTTNYYEKPMIKLQDALGGGGGSSYTAGDGIDITNDVISVTGKVDTSAITTTITSSSTDAQVPSAKAVYDQFGGLKLVKLTQSEYDSLTTKDSQTLYVVTNS